MSCRRCGNTARNTAASNTCQRCKRDTVQPIRIFTPANCQVLRSFSAVKGCGKPNAEILVRVGSGDEIYAAIDSCGHFCVPVSEVSQDDGFQLITVRYSQQKKQRLCSRWVFIRNTPICPWQTEA